MNIGERVRIVRETEGLGRQIFSKETGIAKTTLIKIETGQRPNFAAIELEKVGNAFPEWAEFLLTGNENEEAKKKLRGNKDYRK